MVEISIGDHVEAEYNSGIYVGKVIEDRRNFFLVEILAVKKHPTQGDLHNPGKVEGVAFHERKALAYKEKTNARKRKVTPYAHDIPSYEDSLNQAVKELTKELNKDDTAYNRAALQRLKSLEKDFYNKKS